MCADVLTQREVDAILSNLDSGQVNLAGGPGPKRSGLPYYDFKRPERISKDQMRAIEALHEAMARNLGASLSGFLRTIVDCKLASVEQITYSEFVLQLPNPTCFNVLSAEPLEGKLVLELNPSIVFPIVDKLLGGQIARIEIPDRPLTGIELRLIERIVDLTLSHLREVWRPISEVNFRIEDTESNPQLLPIAPPNDGVVLVVFEIRMGQAAGQINLCIPYTTIDPVLNALSNFRSWLGVGRGRGVDQTIRDHLGARLEQATVEMVAELSETRLSIAELLDLEVGDLLTTGKPRGAPAVIRVAGRAKFLGQAGALHGRRAVRIAQHVRSRGGP